MRNFFIPAFFALLICLPFALRAEIAERSPMKTEAKIKTPLVTDRPIYGGLGNANGPIGHVTEFFQPDDMAPYFSMGGDHAAFFSSGFIYIAHEGERYYICDKENTLQSCLPCPDCAAEIEKLRALDFAIAAPRYRQMRAEMDYSALTMDAQHISFVKPIPVGNKKGNPFVRATAPAQNAEAVIRRFAGKVFLFTSDAAAEIYLCPRRHYDSSVCLICLDCAEKKDLFTPVAEATPDTNEN